jgi:hypothetical protein
MKVANGVRAMVSSEGAVLRDLRRGGTFSLNPLGASVWKLLQQGRSVEQIIDQLSADYETPRETIERDVRSFLGILESHKLVIAEKAAV